MLKQKVCSSQNGSLIESTFWSAKASEQLSFKASTFYKSSFIFLFTPPNLKFLYAFVLIKLRMRLGWNYFNKCF